MLPYSLLALLLVWITLFTAFRSYRVSALQEKLAALRDRLPADEAGNPEFQRVHRLLAAAIRQSALMTFTRLLLASMAQRYGYIPPAARTVAGNGAQAGQLHREMHALLARHVIAGCPLLWPFLRRAEAHAIPLLVVALDDLLERG